MSTTLNLPFKRFVAQVSSAPARSKSSYIALMNENLERLKSCPWREASDVSASLSGHDFTAHTQFSDAYDAYKLTGNYETVNMTEIAYAGMAAYRFKIPVSATSGGVRVTSVSLPVSRDRFLKNGMHLAAVLSASAEPSADWDTVRGSGATAASSVLAQSAATLMEGSAGATTVTIDLSGVSSGNPAEYLWVYVTLEDYTDRWEMYNAKEKRLYAIEGSAMIAGRGSSVTFDGSVTADVADAYFSATPLICDITQQEWAFNGGTVSADQLGMFGGLLRTFYTSAVLFSESAPLTELVVRLDRLRGVVLFSGDQNPLGASAPISTPIGEIGVIGGVRLPVRQTGSDYAADMTMFYNLYCAVARHYDQAMSGLDGVSGNAFANAWVVFRYLAYCVPPGKTEYRSMNIEFNGSRTVTSGFSCDLLVWRTTSADVFGPFGSAALAALAGSPAFFTGGSDSISGSFTSDGPVNVTAQASFCKRVDLSAITAQTSHVAVDLDTTVFPGDALIFVLVPSLKLRTTVNGNGELVLDLGQPYISFA